MDRPRSKFRPGHAYDVWSAERYARRRTAAQPPLPSEFTFGYLHPTGGCPHSPPCSPAGSKPYGGNEQGSRCAPQPKQAHAHVSTADILFYGGAVGGGKSEYAIVEAVTLCLIYPGQKVAIFRRTLTQLEQELEGRIILLTWADDKNFRGPNGKLFCKYNRQRHVFKFWNGSELHLCFCNRESDVYKYQSFQIIGLFLDESSHFTEFMVQYLMTRVRRARAGVPKVIRFTSNPGNVGHGWHKRWFIKPKSEELGSRPIPQPFEVWRPLPRKGDPTPPEDILTRQFIPAWFHDNIALKTADPHYLGQVYALGGDKAKQLAEGDWDANESMIVGAFWRERHRIMSTDTAILAWGGALQVDAVIPWHVYPSDVWRPPVGSKIYGSVDYGFGAPWSFHLHATLPGGHTRTFFEFYEAGVRDAEQAKRIWRALNEQTFRDSRTPLLEGLEYIVYEPMMGGSRKEVGLAKSIIEVYQDETQHKVQFLQGAGGRPARMSRPNRWMDALSIAPDGFPWWACTSGCPHLIRTVPEVPWEEVDGHRGEVEDEKSENHCLAEGTLVLTRAGEQPIETVLPGDEVLTRAGYQVVERAWQTSAAAPVFEVISSDGHQLRATANHRIWTENRGFVRVDSLRYEDILLTDEQVRNICRLSQFPSSSPQPFRNGAANATTDAVLTSRGSVEPGPSQSASADCIATSGRTFTDLFRRVTTFIIGTRTEPTTAQTTWSCERTASTSDTTAGTSRHVSAPLAGGISAWRRLHEWLSRRRSLTDALAATRPASCNGQGSGSTAARSADSVRVMSVRPVAIVPVYDLTVADAHEFIANGILVHNCYEDVGRFFEARPHAPRAEAIDPLAHLNDDPVSKRHQEELARKDSPKAKRLNVGSLTR